MVLCCISFDSYIKPQRIPSTLFVSSVVYLLIPTSNHNIFSTVGAFAGVVYLLIPTSNHNPRVVVEQLPHVVYLLIPTSNHNHHSVTLYAYKLYIF